MVKGILYANSPSLGDLADSSRSCFPVCGKARDLTHLHSYSGKEFILKAHCVLGTVLGTGETVLDMDIWSLQFGGADNVDQLVIKH